MLENSSVARFFSRNTGAGESFFEAASIRQLYWPLQILVLFRNSLSARLCDYPRGRGANHTWVICRMPMALLLLPLSESHQTQNLSETALCLLCVKPTRRDSAYGKLGGDVQEVAISCHQDIGRDGDGKGNNGNILKVPDRDANLGRGGWVHDEAPQEMADAVRRRFGNPEFVKQILRDLVQDVVGTQQFDSSRRR